MGVDNRAVFQLWDRELRGVPTCAEQWMGDDEDVPLTKSVLVIRVPRDGRPFTTPLFGDRVSEVGDLAEGRELELHDESGVSEGPSGDG